MAVALAEYYVVHTTPWVLFTTLHRYGRGGLEQRKGSAVHQEWNLQPNKPSTNEGEFKKVSGRQKLPAVPLFSRLKGIHGHNIATGRNKEILREGIQ